MTIKTPSDFGRALKQGAFAWPGGHPLFFICRDGAALSFDYAKRNGRLICAALREPEYRTGWEVCAVAVNWEDTDLYCESGAKIESAYGN